MAVKKNTNRRTSTRRTTSRPTAKQSERGGVFDYFRLSESYASLLLGLVVVVVAAILLISFLRNRNASDVNTNQNISATMTTEQANSANPVPGGTYVVQSGDDLWKIAEKVYKDGYKWSDIAQANNIVDPSMITVGQKLSLPKVESEVAQAVSPTVTQPAPTAVTLTPMPDAQETPSTGDAKAISGMEYTVVRGDYLWDIAVRAYGDGYKWVDIARANNLVNPNVIHAGNVLTIPRKG